MDSIFRFGGKKLSSPSFFKIINSPTQHVRVPPTFVQQHGKEFASNGEVFLNVPNGVVKWQVECIIREPDGEVWFGKGFELFTDFYSVEHNYFLVFDYKFHSNFEVIIFDLSATEINYPSPPTLKPVFNESSRTAKTGRRLPKDFSNEAMEKAMAFKSEKPFFVVAMRPSYVKRGRSLMNMPADFLKIVSSKGPVAVKLVSSENERSWSVTCCGRSFCRNWRNVVADNKLKVGDACVFEHISGNVFKLIVFHRV